jgi:hypothetical protein
MVASSSGSISTRGSSTSPLAAKRSSKRWTSRQRGEAIAQLVEALLVGDQELRARVGQAVLELGAFPPRVERHHDRAGRGGAPERDRPLRVVAHGDRDSIALRYTEPIA